jgi:beta-galactosidase
MKIRYCLAAFTLLILNSSLVAQNSVNRPLLFDSGWKFHRGGALSAEKPDFNDSEWRRLDLPHDWSIEDLPAQTLHLAVMR